MAGNTQKNQGKKHPISIAILAVGGQGGGVLSNWLVAVAESCGWIVQATSVPGVAQRTGATIYYLEMIQKSSGGKPPVLALMPSPGQVDLVVATEWMEAGRAIQRGLVSKDKTCLIASTHRAFAVAEKIIPGDGIKDAAAVNLAAEAVSRIFLPLDLAKLAEDNGSVISASSLGAIAGSGVLPFSKADFENAIRKAGVGVKPSLKAFDAAYWAAQKPVSSPSVESSKIADKTSFPPSLTGGSKRERKKYQMLQNHLEAHFPQETHAMIHAGLNRVIDFHNSSYGKEYLSMLEKFYALDKKYAAKSGFALTCQLAKYLANAMAYQDVIRVADLKTRHSRFERVRLDAGVGTGQGLNVTEFMHPRIEEMGGLFPHSMRFLVNGKIMQFLLGLISGGKRVRSDTLKGFLLLYLLSGMRDLRRISIRHHQEKQHINLWLGKIEAVLAKNYDLAVEIARCRRLIKGYSDTHARGLSKYDRVMKGIDQIAKRPDAADWARRLRDAALADADGNALDGALKTLQHLK